MTQQTQALASFTPVSKLGSFRKWKYLVNIYLVIVCHTDWVRDRWDARNYFLANTLTDTHVEGIEIKC